MKGTTKEQWLKARSKGIGSSDVAAVLGISPFKTNIELWEEKMGLREQTDISELEYVKNGTLSEAPLRELFKIDYPEYEVDYKENFIMVSPTHSFVRCSPDSLLTEKETGRKGFLEIKRVEIRNGNQYSQWANNQIPNHYYTQTLQYFLSNPDIEFGYLRAYILRFFNDKVIREVRDYKIANSRLDLKDDLDYLLQEEIKFWNYIEKGVRPPKILHI